MWTAPAGVYDVSVVAIGGGGGGANSSNGGNGGAGGGLGWKNNIPVVPGSSYVVRVASGGAAGTRSTSESGGTSYFVSSSLVSGDGGTYGDEQDYISFGGSFTGDGGGSGGRAGTGGTTYSGGGGGAGGYSGDGGSGSSSLYGDGGNGSGGGGGAGGNAGPSDASGAGGGVGIYGEGSSGAGGAGSTANAQPGLGGSGGQDGSSSPGSVQRPSTGGNFGGGGGGADGIEGEQGPGGSGAVRIIWGPGVSYPNNAILGTLPVHIAGESGVSIGTTSATITVPITTEPGDLIVAFWAVAGTSLATSLPNTSGYTSLYQGYSSSVNNTSLSISYKVADGDTSVVFPPNGNSTFSSTAVVKVIRGVDVSGIDCAAGNAAGTILPSFSNISVSNPNTMLLPFTAAAWIGGTSSYNLTGSWYQNMTTTGANDTHDSIIGVATVDVAFPQTFDPGSSFGNGGSTENTNFTSICGYVVLPPAIE